MPSILPSGKGKIEGIAPSYKSWIFGFFAAKIPT